VTRLPSVLDDRAQRKISEAAATALKQCTPAARELAHRQLAQALSTLLDLDVTGLVAGAWRSSDELVQAAERTRREPGSRAVVDVAEQHFAEHREAVLEITVDGALVTELPVELDIGIEVKSLTAALKDGCIVELASGECSITTTLSLDQVELPSKTTELDLRLSITLDPPVSLTRPAPPPPPPRPAGRVVVLPDAEQPATQRPSARPEIAATRDVSTE
jgi:hypothetical protein